MQRRSRCHHSGPWLQQEFVIRAEELEAYFIALLRQVGAIPDLSTPMRLVYDFLGANYEALGLPRPARETVVETSPLVSQIVMSLTSDDESRLPIPKLTGLSAWESLKADFRKRNMMDSAFPDHRAWDGLLPLADLFDSEDAPTAVDSAVFFDQRYIDYLAQQGEDLADINWRQFERLTSEYFKRIGYDVTLLSGRKDGGKDIVARRDGLVGPELILIQCKRYAESRQVGLETVKAFWATVQDEVATKGLVATTSSITSGARDYCDARMYRLGHADKLHVREWLRIMSSQSGVPLRSPAA